jgi:hypothetical protein
VVFAGTLSRALSRCDPSEEEEDFDGSPYMLDYIPGFMFKMMTTARQGEVPRVGPAQHTED